MVNILKCYLIPKKSYDTLSKDAIFLANPVHTVGSSRPTLLIYCFRPKQYDGFSTFASVCLYYQVTVRVTELHEMAKKFECEIYLNSLVVVGMLGRRQEVIVADKFSRLPVRWHISNLKFT